jgi:hypothetical protein
VREAAGLGTKGASEQSCTVLSELPDAQMAAWELLMEASSSRVVTRSRAFQQRVVRYQACPLYQSVRLIALQPAHHRDMQCTCQLVGLK